MNGPFAGEKKTRKEKMSWRKTGNTTTGQMHMKTCKPQQSSTTVIVQMLAK